MNNLLLSAVLSCLLLVPPAPADEPKLLKACPAGRLYRHGGQRVLLLAGEPYEMGYAHGKLLAEDIRTLTARVLLVCRVADTAKGKGWLAGTVDKAWNRLKPHIAQRYLDELRGLADGSGVPLKDIQMKY
jgi:isopenicillin-N N-acyltransferase like protein